MKVALHNQAIYLLLQELAPTKPEGILIDQFTPENNYRKYVRNEKIKSLKNCSSSLKESSIMLLLLPPLLLAMLLFRRVRQRICRIGFLCALWSLAQIRPSSRPYFEKRRPRLISELREVHFANTQKPKSYYKINTKQKSQYRLAARDFCLVKIFSISINRTFK